LIEYDSPRDETFHQLALFLLGNWYAVYSVKNSGSKIRHADDYLEFLAQLMNQNNKWFKPNVLRSTGIQENTYFTDKMKTHISNSIYFDDYNRKWEPLFKLVYSLVRSNLKSDTSKKFSKLIHRRFKNMWSQMKGLNSNPSGKFTSFSGLSILTCEDYKDDQDNSNTEGIKVLTSLRKFNDLESKSHEVFRIVSQRITRIFCSLDILHRIAMLNNLDIELLGTEIKNTHDDLIKWFIETLFHQNINISPVLGQGEIQFPLEQKYIGAPQRFLSRILTDSVNIRCEKTTAISLLLLGYWYEIRSVKMNPQLLDDSSPKSYWTLMAQTVDPKTQNELAMKLLHFCEKPAATVGQLR
jgi:hypothetical protein